MNYITINTISQVGKTFDCLTSIRGDKIAVMMDANQNDRKQRPDCNTLIVLETGQTFATDESRSAILAKIEDANKSF